jgi:hypothetical protein
MDIQFGAWLWEGRALDELRIGYVLTVILGGLRSIFSDLAIYPTLFELT